MNKIEKRALNLSIFIVIVGFIVELFFNESNAISRAGSLITCVGIYFGYIDLSSIYKDNFNKLIIKLESKRLENDIVFSDEQLKDKKLKGTTYSLKQNASNKLNKDEKRVNLIYMLILILGTFIWGFGDLVFKYMR